MWGEDVSSFSNWQQTSNGAVSQIALGTSAPGLCRPTTTILSWPSRQNESDLCTVDICVPTRTTALRNNLRHHLHVGETVVRRCVEAVSAAKVA
jgi:hypothetical protein